LSLPPSTGAGHTPFNVAAIGKERRMRRRWRRRSRLSSRQLRRHLRIGAILLDAGPYPVCFVVDARMAD
jgi:hypothetical protein